MRCGPDPLTAHTDQREATMAYTDDPRAKFTAHSKPLTKVHKSNAAPDERAELLAKAASCGDPTLLRGYQQRLRDLPESGPTLPTDAAASVAAMVDVLAARGNATQSRELAAGYFGRARSLRQWLDHGR
jgi:hypothetical protein